MSREAGHRRFQYLRAQGREAKEMGGGRVLGLSGKGLVATSLHSRDHVQHCSADDEQEAA